MVVTIAHADSVVVLTSFPSEMTTVYKRAFEAKHPGTTVEVVNMGTSRFLPHLKNLAAGQRPDVVWASDLGAFAEMAHAKLLQSAPQVRNKGIPQTIGPLPMNGPEDLYFGQALSGYGLSWNVDYLSARGLVAPRSWADLAQPAYFGHLLISSPSRSGTTHLTVEAILQAEGWDAGWALLRQIGGGSASITKRSNDVQDEVNEGKAGIGVVVDFFGLAGQSTGYPVQFAYPANTVVLPASIGVVAGARSQTRGEQFVQFALSNEGQELLYDPQISRMPASPFAAASLKVPANFPNVYAIARKSPLTFNMDLYTQRRTLVKVLFDSTITDLHAELRAAIRSLHQAERKLQGSTNAEAIAQLQQARAKLVAPVVSAKEGVDAAFLAKLNAAEANSSALASQWREKAKANYAEVSSMTAKLLR